jgi:hypothetical protein
MTAARLPRRLGDGSAATRGWTALITLGLPAPMRDRRRGEVAADLDEESIDAVRRHTQATRGRRRLVRLIRGIPDDFVWRFVDARAIALDYRVPTVWVPLDRWSSLLLGAAAVGATGGLVLVGIPLVTGQLGQTTWLGWGPVGFTIACLGALIAIVLAVPWPRRAVLAILPALVIGFAAAPWLWGCWLMAAMAVGLRLHQSTAASS